MFGFFKPLKYFLKANSTLLQLGFALVTIYIYNIVLTSGIAQISLKTTKMGHEHKQSDDQTSFKPD